MQFFISEVEHQKIVGKLLEKKFLSNLLIICRKVFDSEVDPDKAKIGFQTGDTEEMLLKVHALILLFFISKTVAL